MSPLIVMDVFSIAWNRTQASSELCAFKALRCSGSHQIPKVR